MVLEKGCMVLCPPSSPRCKYRASRPEFPLRSCGVQISGEVAWPGRHKLHKKQEMLWSTFVTDTSADFPTILATGLQGSDPNFNHDLSRNVVPSLCPHDLVIAMPVYFLCLPWKKATLESLLRKKAKPPRPMCAAGNAKVRLLF